MRTKYTPIIFLLLASIVARSDLLIPPGLLKSGLAQQGGEVAVDIAAPAVDAPSGTITYPVSFTSPTQTFSEDATTPAIAAYMLQGIEGDTLTATTEESITALNWADGSSTGKVSFTTVSNMWGHATLAASGPQILGAQGYDSFVINAPENRWISPEYESGGTTFDVMGANLLADDGLAYIYIEEEDAWYSTTNATEYRATFSIPSLTSGNYTVWTHAGQLGDYGWGGSNTLTVIDPVVYTATSTVTAGSESDLRTKSYAASPNTIIDVPEGTYSLTSELTSIFRVNGTDLAAGSGLTSNLWIRGNGNVVFVPDATYSADYGVNTLINGGNQFSGTFYMENVKISGITFDGGDGSPEMEALVTLAGRNCKLEDCTFTHTSITSDTLLGNMILGLGGAGVPSRDITVEGCTFEQGARVSLGVDFLRYHSNTNLGMFDLGTLVKLSQADNVSVMNCYASHYSTNDYTDAYGWSQGRWLGGNYDGGACRNVFVENNRTMGMVPRYNYDIGAYDAEQAHQNAGENIMFEGANAVMTNGAFGLSFTANTVTFGTAYSAWSNQLFSVTEGAGMGYYARIVDVNTGTGVITLDKPFLVQPDTSSKLLIGKFYSDFVIHGNTLDARYRSWHFENPRDTANIGVSFYGNGYGHLVDSNRFQNIESCVGFWNIDEEHYDQTNFTGAANFWGIAQNNYSTNTMNGYFENIYGFNDTDYPNRIVNFGTAIRRNTAHNVLDTGYGISSDATATTEVWIASSVFENNTMTMSNAPAYSGTYIIDTQVSGNTLTYQKGTWPVPPPDTNDWGNAFAMEISVGGADTFTVPTDSGSMYTGRVWVVDTSDDSIVSSNSFTAYNDANLTVSLPALGVYQVVIDADEAGEQFPRILCNNSAADRNLITKVLSLGNPGWQSFSGAFDGCGNLVSVTAGTMTNSTAISYANAFRRCVDLVSVDFSVAAPKTSSMSYTFNGDTVIAGLDLSMFDTSSMTSMSSMAGTCPALTVITITGWDISLCTVFGNVANSSTLTTDSYSAFLNVLGSHDDADISDGESLNMGSSKYNSGAVAARAVLTSNNSWSITDAGLE